jgi:serine protease Do
MFFRMKPSTRWSFVAAVKTSPLPLMLLIAAWLSAALPCAAPAQGMVEDSVLDEQARDEEFQAIGAEVDFLERQFRLLKRVVRFVKPSVVHIEARKTLLPRSTSRPVEEAGSGAVIQLDESFYILTNRHVVKDAELSDIKIELADGRRLTPSRIWTDHGTDVAVIAVSDKKLTAARLGDSSKIEIGDFVLAVGSPFGLSHSVTYGIISAKGRRNLELGDSGVRYQDFMQTDAAINPGNSGGPLINIRGEVIGINTAIASSGGGNEGIGFTIPVNMAMIIAKQLVEKGSVSRAFLGVHMDSRFGPEMATQLGMPRPTGARVSGITPDSPAAEGDIRVGDVILQFNGVRVDDDSHLVNLVSLTPIGKAIDVYVFRGGKTQKLSITVGDRRTYENR